MLTVGNEAGHGVGLSIEQAEAKDILEFTNAIMDYLDFVQRSLCGV